MIRNQKQIPASGLIKLILVLGSALAVRTAYTDDDNWFWVIVLMGPLLMLVIKIIQQKGIPF